MLQNYINGKWVYSESKRKQSIINPATEEVLDDGPLSLSNEAEDAIDAAQAAFESWRLTPVSDRIQYIFKLKTLMEKKQSELAQLITYEHGKTLVESKGSVKRAIQMLETAAAMPSLMMGDALDNIAPGIDCVSVRKPLGVFTAICPFNFPIMVPFWFWPFAIASGNTFVLKASERTPLSSIRLFSMLSEIGLPDGVMNLILGDKEVVDVLCTHPSVKGVSFVGSTPVAKKIYALASSHGKRAQVLGGAKNVMVIAKDSMDPSCEKKTVETAYESITGCAGERCLAGSLVLCEGQEAYEKSKLSFVQLAQKTILGNGIHPHTTMGPLISIAAKERVLGLIDRAIKEGAELLYDGRSQSPGEKGYFIGPTVLGNIHQNMEIAKEEIFGPVVLIAKIAHLKEAIQWINQLNFANTTTLFTQQGGVAKDFISMVSPTMIGINIGVPAPMSYFSFGGSKDSFFGDVKAHGKECVQFFTESQTTIYRWNSQQGIW